MKILIRIVAYSARYKGALTLALASLIASTLLSLVVPRFLGTAIDLALGSGQRSQLVLLALLILVISALRGVTSYAYTYLGEAVSQRVAYDLRNAFYDKLQHLSFAFHDQQKTGDLMSMATVDVENSRTFINMGLIRALYLIILVGGVAVLMLTTHWKLGLISLAAVPVAGYMSVRMSRRLRLMWRKVQDETGQLTTVLQENLSGVRVVKGFGAEDYEISKFTRQATKVADNTFDAMKLHSDTSAFFGLIYLVLTGVVLWFGGREVLAGNLTAGELTQFLFYLGLLIFPVRILGFIVNSFSRAVSSGERILGVLDTPSPVVEKRDAVDPGMVRGHVRFINVSFAYRDGVPALRNINFEIEPGKKVALVGAAGSGKSTIANLLPRFYDVSDGKITIDGIDIRDMKLSALRRNIGVVFQDVFLFSATVRDNIAYGSEKASLEQVMAAAKAAQIHDFIMSLPQGYDTWVGERGVNLSGGQRQRIAIARTLLLNPPILVLDDSTSSVDAETEHLIQMALQEVMKGRTTIIIAHRLSSLRNADEILVLKDGEIVERGTHEELLRRGGFYSQIYELQIAPREDVEAPAPGAMGERTSR